MLNPIKVAAVQFETHDNDKAYNLSVIRRMCERAAADGADIVAFHECSVCGYTFAKELSREELLAIASPSPETVAWRCWLASSSEMSKTVYIRHRSASTLMASRPSIANCIHSSIRQSFPATNTSYSTSRVGNAVS